MTNVFQKLLSPGVDNLEVISFSAWKAQSSELSWQSLCCKTSPWKVNWVRGVIFTQQRYASRGLWCRCSSYWQNYGFVSIIFLTVAWSNFISPARRSDLVVQPPLLSHSVSARCRPWYQNKQQHAQGSHHLFANDYSGIVGLFCKRFCKWIEYFSVS